MSKPFPKNGTTAAKVQWMEREHGFVDHGALDPCSWCSQIHCVCTFCGYCGKSQYGECQCDDRDEED
jgi:hypothetical protein